MKDIMLKILSQIKTFEKVFRFKSEIIWIIVGQLGVMIAGVLGIKLLTQALPPTEFGRFALANTFILLISTNLFGPVGQGLMRFWSIADERKELSDFSEVSKKIIQKFSYWTICFGAGLVIILFFLKDVAWAILFSVSVISGVLSGCSIVLLSILMAARERKTIAIINICASFAKPLAGVLFIHIFSTDASYVLLGYLIILCVIAFVSKNYFDKKVTEKAFLNPVKISENKYSSYLKTELFAFIWPFYIWGFFGWMHQSCDRWALQSFHGVDVVGAFFVVSQLSVYPLVAGSSFLSAFFTPIAYQRAGKLNSDDDFKSANKIIFMMSGFYLIGSVLLILLYSFFHRWLILTISSEQYTGYSGLLPWLTGIWALYYLGQMVSGFGLLANKPVLYMAPIIASGSLASVLTFLLSSKYGVIGVVWGLGVSCFVYAIWFSSIAFFLIRKKKNVSTI